ncbi:MAG: glycine cleavage system protein GcvH [Ignavibacteriaceae bacterium]
MNFPSNLKYTKEHEWISIEGTNGLIGITEYAQSELGDIVYLDIDPNIGAVKKGDSMGTIEAVKTVSELYAPCTGKIVEVNSQLQTSPELINSDPYGQGWMIKIEIADLNELGDLLDSEAYKKLIGK